jgi:predicted NAD/FAD-binding protein
MRIRNFSLPRDITVDEWAKQLRQPEEAVRYFWEPLCVAALSTPYTRASAQVFLRVCRDAFSRARADSDLLVVQRPLAEILPGPAERFLKAQGVDIR